MPPMTAQFEVPGAQSVTLVKAPFTSPAGFDVPPPAVRGATLFAGVATVLVPGVVELLLPPPHPASQSTVPIKIQLNDFDTATP
jgi:hypothetical protein